MRTYINRSAQGYGGPLWTEVELAYLRLNYTTMTAREIAEHLGRTTQAVHARASKLGLVSRHRLGVNSLIKDYFKVIDTPMKAWVLGLLASDGSMSKAGQLKLELHRKDLEIVVAVRDELAPEARISYYNTRTTPMARFMISDPGLRADLASHGVVNAKTLITAWPTDLPREFVNSFVCGYYDGDGSLGLRPIPRWSVVSGVPEFLRIMQAQIHEHTGIWPGGPYEDKRHEHAWSIVQTGEPVRVLDEWIHRDVPGLARKRLTPLPEPDKEAQPSRIGRYVGNLESLEDSAIERGMRDKAAQEEAICYRSS